MACINKRLFLEEVDFDDIIAAGVDLFIQSNWSQLLIVLAHAVVWRGEVFPDLLGPNRANHVGGGKDSIEWVKKKC